MSILTELTTGPLSNEIAPHIASGNDGAIVEILNRRDIPSYGWITAADLNTWFALHNAEYINVKALAMDTSSPFYAAANALLNCLSGSVGENALNLAAPEIMTMVDNWPFVDPQSKADLLEKGQKLISRAEQLGIAITEVDVRREIWNDDGSRKL